MTKTEQDVLYWTPQLRIIRSGEVLMELTDVKGGVVAMRTFGSVILDVEEVEKVKRWFVARDLNNANTVTT